MRDGDFALRDPGRDGSFFGGMEVRISRHTSPFQVEGWRRSCRTDGGFYNKGHNKQARFKFNAEEDHTMSDDVRKQIIEELKVAYWMEIETVMNYIANSINLDGVRAEEIKKALAADVQEELGHAQVLARRIKTIGGEVPGSQAFSATQDALQPCSDHTDVKSVIKGVIAAEDGAIKQYNKLIKLCDGVDYVTQDLCITSLADEEEHRRDFMGYLTEYEQRS
ncbi:Ferritin-like domain protein [Symmachiella dynata]|nr:Ferritin-like domain protein [Symmachiella dynata]